VAASEKKTINLMVDVANDPYTREQGLMYKKHLGENRGMLFCFASDRHLSFWMSNTYIPLDIAFLSSDFKVLDIKPLIPLSLRPVKSSTKCRYALEVNRGWFAKNNVVVGHSFGDSIKTAGAEEFNVRITQNFVDALDFAIKNGLNMEISYMYTGGHRGMLDHQLATSGTAKLPSGKIFERDGDNITVVDLTRGGQPRTFKLDDIVGYQFITKDGPVNPHDIRNYLTSIEEGKDHEQRARETLEQARDQIEMFDPNRIDVIDTKRREPPVQETPPPDTQVQDVPVQNVPVQEKPPKKKAFLDDWSDLIS